MIPPLLSLNKVNKSEQTSYGPEVMKVWTQLVFFIDYDITESRPTTIIKRKFPCISEAANYSEWKIIHTVQHSSRGSTGLKFGSLNFLTLH